VGMVFPLYVYMFTYAFGNTVMQHLSPIYESTAFAISMPCEFVSRYIG